VTDSAAHHDYLRRRILELNRPPTSSRRRPGPVVLNSDPEFGFLINSAYKSLPSEDLSTDLGSFSAVCSSAATIAMATDSRSARRSPRRCSATGGISAPDRDAGGRGAAAKINRILH
jgi:hypothetical protein